MPRVFVLMKYLYLHIFNYIVETDTLNSKILCLDGSNNGNIVQSIFVFNLILPKIKLFLHLIFVLINFINVGKNV